MKHLGHRVQILCHHLGFIRKYMGCLDNAQICTRKAESHWKIMNVSVVCTVHSIIGFICLKFNIYYFEKGNLNLSSSLCSVVSYTATS